MEIAKAPQRKPVQLYRDLLKNVKEESDSSDNDDDGDLLSQERPRQKILNSIRAVKSQISLKGEILCVDDLEAFVKENSFNESNNQEFFVADALLGDGTKESPIIITLTSRTCLNFIKKQAETCIPQFACDAPSKINDLGYPLITTVTQGVEHSIFPTSFSIVSTESEITYSFAINALKKATLSYSRKRLNSNLS